MARSILRRLAAGAALAAAVAAGPAAAETLKAAHFVSPKHPVGVAFETFANELKKNTDGKLTVKIFAAESLLGAKAISDGVRDDVADLGFIITTYTPSYYPHGVLINDMAMIGENDMASAFAYTELYMLDCKPCRAEYERQNLVFLSATSTAPYVLIAKGDMNGVDKIKGKKLRAGGSLWDRFAQSVGATGVNLPTSETYEGLSRGIMDGVFYAVGGLKSLGLADVANQVVMLKLGSFRAGALVAFNRDVWSKFTADERAAVFKSMSVALVTDVNAYHASDEEGFAVGKQKGIKFVDPDPGLVKERDAFVAKDMAGVIDHARKELGVADAQAFVDGYKKLYAKYEKLVEPIQKDPAQLSALIYKEVYAKLDPAKYEVK